MMHDIKRNVMRTTLAIDNDVLAAAKHLAERDGKSVGEIISMLARQGLERETRGGRSERNGIPLLAARRGAMSVTPELVNQLRDELT
ncbi:MAG: CopG family transcriptional regulator [Burkholderiaceae bacterium]